MRAPTPTATDAGPLPDGASALVRAARARPAARFASRYLTMRDGVPIAIDLYLPHDVERGARVPAIVHQTRYFRATGVRAPLRWALGTELPSPVDATRARFLSNGYAWIDVDARGSGASGGRRPHPWSVDEVRDGAEVVDWIVAQPWSTGRVGATGVSYAGTAAEFLATTRHPALAAVAPRFSLFDVFTDIAFPGGVHLSWFTERWGALNALIDRNAYGAAFAAATRLAMQALRPFSAREGPRWLDALARALDRDSSERLLRLAMDGVSHGVRRVDDDARGERIARALLEHADNFDVHADALALTHRDDPSPSPPHDPLGVFSPHRLAGEIAASGLPVLNVSGWLDGAYPHAAVKRFHAVPTPGSRLLLGPWDHGGGLYVSPWASHRAARFDQDAELVAFFDLHLKRDPEARAAGRPVHYFTTGEERWKSAETWPPPGVTARPFYLDRARRLVASAAPPPASRAEHRFDPRAATGPQSRWNCLIGSAPRVGYPDRAERDRILLCHDSEPLAEPLEVTGHPVVEIHLRTSAPDLTLFAYLEDVAPDGTVRYVTEGMLRALHRRLSDGSPPHPLVVPHRSFERADAAPIEPGEIAELRFDLLPVSHRFGAGHRIRLALAGGDADHFATLPGPTPAIELSTGGDHASRLELPVLPPGVD